MKPALIILFIFLSAFSYAQTGNKAWRIGIKTDLNFSTIKGKGMASGYSTGAQFGGFAEKPLGHGFSLQPELLFTQTNARKGDNFMTYYNTDGNLFAADNIRLGYLTVPLMAKYQLNKYLSVLAGPQYSLMLFDAESLVDDNKGVAFKRYEWSANAGLQFTIGSVSLYGRYNAGLTNINAIDNRYAWRASHWQTGIAIRIF